MHVDAGLGAAVPGAPVLTGANRQGKINDAAKQFEALLLGQMLESSHAFGGEEDGEEQNSALTGYGQQQFAQALSASGGLGIAKMVVAGLNRDANR